MNILYTTWPNVCAFLSGRLLDMELLGGKIFTFKILTDNIKSPSTRLCHFILHTLTNPDIIILKKILSIWWMKYSSVSFALLWLVKLNVSSCIYGPFVFLNMWSACSYPLLISSCVSFSLSNCWEIILLYTFNPLFYTCDKYFFLSFVFFFVN